MNSATPCGVGTLDARLYNDGQENSSLLPPTSTSPIEMSVSTRCWSDVVVQKNRVEYYQH